MQIQSKLGFDTNLTAPNPRGDFLVGHQFDGCDSIALDGDGQNNVGRVFFLPIVVSPEISEGYLDLGKSISALLLDVINSETIERGGVAKALCGFFVSFNELMYLEPSELTQLTHRLVNSKGYLANECLIKSKSEMPLLSFLAIGVVGDRAETETLRFKNWPTCKWKLEQIVASIVAASEDIPSVSVHPPTLYRQALINGTVAAVTEFKKYAGQLNSAEGQVSEIDIRLNESGHAVLQISNEDYVTEIALDPERLGKPGIEEIIAAAFGRAARHTGMAICN